MKTTLWATITGSLVMLGVSQEVALALYDGSLNTHPDAQGWLYTPRNPSANPSVPNAVRSLTGAGTTLTTTADFRSQSGYSISTQTLNRTTGYNLRFNLQLLSEDHSASSASKNPGTDNIADRAGLSIIALSSDKRGIELGFWNNLIWAQADGPVKADPTLAPTGTRFTQAEGAAFNTQAAMTQYDLSILNNTYYLYGNGSLLLSGSLRDYSQEAIDFPIPGAPYNVPNLVYIGDNTTSAQGSFTLNRVEYTNSAIAPVPFGFNPLLGIGLFALNRVRQTMQNKQAKS